MCRVNNIKLETKILNILKEYYNSKIDRVEFIRQGGCVSYAVKSGNTELFLKVISNVFIKTAIKSIHIQEYLIKNNFPVPKIIYTNTDRAFLEIDNQLFVMYEFIKGAEPVLDENIEQIGKLVGGLHSLMNNYGNDLIKQEKHFFVDRYVNILKQKGYNGKHLCEYMEIGDNLWNSIKDLSYGFCHGDLHRGNLLKTAENKIYMLDFDTACFAPQLFDIAVMCDTTDYFNFGKNEFYHTTDIFNRFMNEYSKYNQIDFTINQFYDFIALRHFQLQATIVEIYGLNCIDEEFIDKQLEWIKQWRNQYM